jgi:hypothetical protein
MAQLEQTQSVLDPPAATPPQAVPASLFPTILRVAWLSIGLGLALEVVLLVIVAFTGTAGDSPRPFVADLVQKVSWSFLVCIGLAFGTTASKAREGIMGLLGLISAPVGFATARAAHKGVAAGLGVAATGSAAFPVLIASLKGIEYALFGAVLAWIGKRALGLKAHVYAGLAFGVVFSLAIVAVTVQSSATPVPLVKQVAQGINELMFPVGCSLVLYAANALSKRL